MPTLSIQSLMQTSNVGFGTSGARGLVSDMTDSLCYAYTRAILQAVVGHAGPVVVGHDLRPSSPRMAAACAAGIRDAGYRVIYAGALPTPALAYYALTLKAPCLVVTGSHIPFDRNGLKFYRADGEISKDNEGLMRAAMVEVPSIISPYDLSLVDTHAKNAYLDRYVGFFGKAALKNTRVAVYEHSSVARDVLRGILEALGATVLSLGRTDTFVPIDTDGDGDRPLIGDETGEWFRGDMVGVLCAQYLKADTVVTPVSSNTAVELCGAFLEVIRTRIGSPYVIAGMLQAKGQTVAGYEANGGFLLGSDVLGENKNLSALPTRDAVLPMLALLCMAREQGVALSKLKLTLPARYTASDRLQDFANEKSTRILRQLSQDLSLASRSLAPDAGELLDKNEVDGLRLTFNNGDIVHLRPSGNAPELRCYAESDSELRAQALCDGALKWVAGR